MIAIVNPPNPPDTVSNKDMMGGFGQLYGSSVTIKIPPIDLLYCAAVLRKRNLHFKIVDCLAENWGVEKLISNLQNQIPDIIAIRTSTPTFEWDLKVAKIIKMHLFSDVIFFGPHCSLFPQETLDNESVDAIILGEPEITLSEILERKQFTGVEGIWYKQDNKIIKNKMRKPIDNLDSLPFPTWDLLPYGSYDGGSDLMRNLKPFVTVQTSRGCPHGCGYCPYPIAQGRKYRFRSPENVVDELEWLVNKLNIKSVLFRDPEFALRTDNVKRICNGIIRRRLKLAWRCETRIENLDKELINLMAEAGCIGINMGIESSDEAVLQNVGRKAVPFDRAKKIIDFCKMREIDTFCFFIFGLPGETKKSAYTTIDYATRLNATFTQFTVATPFFGTSLRTWAEKNKFIENYALSKITGYDAAMRNENMTIKEIMCLQSFANLAITMKGSRVIERILINPRNVISEIRRWIGFLKYRLRSC
jgi:anaerobic magnesium-protoporphyrin IX monomethyl ester cyclase